MRRRTTPPVIARVEQPQARIWSAVDFEYSSMIMPAIPSSQQSRRDQTKPFSRRLLRVRVDELLNDGRNLFAPLAAVEDAVMADILGKQIVLFGPWQLG